jgi:hypothetical protein
LRSRLNSCFSSRFCSFFSCFVNFPSGDEEGVKAAFGDDVDVTVGDGNAELVGFVSRGLNFCAWDLDFPGVISG